jgi:hypothetical protein
MTRRHDKKSLRAIPEPVRRLPISIFALLAAPRLLRFMYPQVWIEDDQLLQTVLATSRGLHPYVQFSLAQMPLLEWIGAAYVMVAGPSLHAMEVLNAVAIYATSVLIVLIGRRVVGQPAAIAGAMLFACSSLVFRYHLWAREFFVSALILGAAYTVLNERLAWRLRVGLFAALSCAACAIKLTAIVSVAGLVLYIAIGQHRPARAVVAALATGIALGLFALFCYSRYGFEFVFQAFLFHFLKGTVNAGVGYVIDILDVIVPVFVLGLAALIVNRQWRRGAVLISCVLGPLTLFYEVLSPTAWGHNYLDPLPWIALVGGVGIVWLIGEWRRLSWKAGAGTALIVVSLIWIAPFNNENASRGSGYGFGFVERSEVAEVAAALGRATAPGDEVVAPSFIAFEANRIQRLRFPENYGVMREGERLYRSVGFREARETFGRRDFFDLINQTSAYWNNQFMASTAVGGGVNAVILDSTIQFLPLVDATDDALTQRGFAPTLRTTHYTLWVRSH